MSERNLEDELDRILSERLREVPAAHPKDLWDVLDLTARWIRRRLDGKPDWRASRPWQWEMTARIRSLPPHLLEPLRRYFVFREAEESICASTGATPRKFRRFLRDAAEYILLCRERMPELETKQNRRGPHGGPGAGS